MNRGGLHRVKRLWRFTDNERVDALEVQMALVPHTIAQLGFPRLLALAIDWTMFDYPRSPDEARGPATAIIGGSRLGGGPP